MNTEDLLNAHAAVKYEKSYADKHTNITLNFAIALLQELERKGDYYGKRIRFVKQAEIENKRLELEMQLTAI